MAALISIVTTQLQTTMSHLDHYKSLLAGPAASKMVLSRSTVVCVEQIKDYAIVKEARQNKKVHTV